MEIKGDWYIKFILTVISVLLLGILLKPSIIVKNSYKNPIPVKIVSGDVKVYGSVDVEGSVEVSNTWQTPLYITEK